MKASLLLLLALLCLPACSRQQRPANVPEPLGFRADGQVEQRPAATGEEGRYPLLVGIRFDHAEALADNPSPVYPPELLALRLPPVEVPILMVVDAQGQVVRVTPLQEAEGVSPLFFEAVRSALLQWRFSPLVRWQGEKAEPLPWSERTIFVFRQVNGRAVPVAPQKASSGSLR